jgi:hypothetical protein
MKFFDKFKRAIGFKHSSGGKDVMKDGQLKAVSLLSDDEQKTLSRAERLKRFQKWHSERG